MTGFKVNIPVKYRSEKLYKVVQKKNVWMIGLVIKFTSGFSPLQPEKDTDLPRPQYFTMDIGLVLLASVLTPNFAAAGCARLRP